MKSVIRLLDSQGEIRPMPEIAAEVINFAINHYSGNLFTVAKKLKISRATLYRRRLHQTAKTAQLRVRRAKQAHLVTRLRK
jgi:DNA-binding NtrC family response regulator